MVEAITDALNLFNTPAIQTAVEKGYWVEIRPTNSIDDDNPIDFEISGSGTDFLDLANTFIKLSARITTPDEQNGFPEAQQVAPINNLLNSMFSKVDVMLNGKTVCSSEYLHAQKAYVETLLNFGGDTKRGELSGSGWYMDTPGEFDTIGEANAGFIARKQLAVNRKLVSLMGRVHADLFTQPGYLIDGVNVHLQLVRAPAAFSIMRANADANEVPMPAYKIKVENIALYVRKVTISSSCRVGIYEAMALSPAIYKTRHVGMRSFSISGGVMSWTQESIIRGQIPRKLAFFFTTTATAHGDYTSNPLNFQHFTINFFSLYVEGRQIPSKTLQPNFVGLNADYVRSYMQMHSGLGTALRDEDSGISYNEFGSGSTVFVFNLTADLTNGEHVEPTNRGSLRAEVHFSEALAAPITCFVHAEYNNIIEINQDRKISIDYLI